jgi:pSer/pThr/pTyr-binding forkhead associated (FHA) protein
VPPTPSRPAQQPPDAATVVSAPAEAAGQRPAYESFVVRLTGPGVDLVVVGPGAHELGRAKEAALRVNHPTVSRRHARIIVSDDRTIAYVQDLGGANRTRLNGREVTAVQPLADGDVLTLGQVELKVTVSRA